MSQLELSKVSKDIMDHAEKAMVTSHGLPKVVDDYFIQRLKQDELQHAEVDPRLYEGMRKTVQAEVLPLFEQFWRETTRLRERRQKRQLWKYLLGTVGVFELAALILTKEKSLAPQILFPSVILSSFIGFIIYTAAQYLDDLQLARARKRLERSIEGLDSRVQTDVEYDQRRELLDADVLRAEAVEILTHYERPEDFWRDYARVRAADPTAPSELKGLNAPAFEKFLRFHVEGHHSPVARQHRFNQLFVEAHEVFIGRDRENYVLKHLKS
jgi:hypothetical protein